MSSPTDSHVRQRFTGWSRRHDLGLFFGLSFTLSWATWPLVALNSESSPLVPFGPLLAALLVASFTGGLGEVRRLLGQLGRWRRPVGWYVVALLGPVGITTAAVAFTMASGARTAVPISPDWPLVVATFLLTVVVVGLFEEVGWRGYALPRLQQRFRPLPAGLLLGVVWAAWHLPELISDPTRQRPPVQFVIFILALSVVLAWLYNATAGSLPVIVGSHAATNTAAQTLLPYFDGPDYQQLWWWLAALWVAVAVLVAAVSGRGPALVHPRREHTS